MINLTNNTWGKIHHANMAQGWASYKANKVEWLRINLEKWGLDETCPYPLTPGTQPVGQGECYKCGHLHNLFISKQCSGPEVDMFETIYRGVMGKIIRESRKAQTQPNLPVQTTPTQQPLSCLFKNFPLANPYN